MVASLREKTERRKDRPQGSARKTDSVFRKAEMESGE
jgi:hypothetical protein